MPDPIFISDSSQRTLNECARKFFWQKEFLGTGIEPDYETDKITEADQGLAIHEGVADLYSRGHYDPETIRARIEKSLGWENLPFYKKNDWVEQIAWIQRLLSEYDGWRKEHDDFTVESLETEGIVPVFEKCLDCKRKIGSDDLSPTCKCGASRALFVFRTDMTVNRGGFLAVVDHKTTSSVGAAWLEQWEYSPQLYKYAWAHEKVTGRKVRAFGVNALKRLKTIGLKEQKQCPQCHAGKKKRLTCLNCEGAGYVDKEPISADKAFFRKWPVWNERTKLWTIGRLEEDIDKVEAYRYGLEEGWNDPYPTNQHACYSFGRICPFIKLCPPFQRREKWWKPQDGELIGFKQRGQTGKVALIKEDMAR